MSNKINYQSNLYSSVENLIDLYLQISSLIFCVRICLFKSFIDPAITVCAKNILTNYRKLGFFGCGYILVYLAPSMKAPKLNSPKNHMHQNVLR